LLNILEQHFLSFSIEDGALQYHLRGKIVATFIRLLGVGLVALPAGMLFVLVMNYEKESVIWMLMSNMHLRMVLLKKRDMKHSQG